MTPEELEDLLQPEKKQEQVVVLPTPPVASTITGGPIGNGGAGIRAGGYFNNIEYNDVYRREYMGRWADEPLRNPIRSIRYSGEEENRYPANELLRNIKTMIDMEIANLSIARRGRIDEYSYQITRIIKARLLSTFKAVEVEMRSTPDDFYVYELTITLEWFGALKRLNYPLEIRY